METWLFIVGYLIHCFGSCVLAAKVLQQKTIYGLAADTQWCLLFATLSRCVWSLETRLVEVSLEEPRLPREGSKPKSSFVFQRFPNSLE